MKAMVLCAGLGTRLRPLTDHLPKPAMPVANRALGSYSLMHLARFGLREVLINSHHLPRALETALLRDRPEGMNLRFVHEPVLLGTGGGLKNAWSGEEPLLVMNGDILFAPGLEGLVAVATNENAIAAMVLRPDPEVARYGAVEVDDRCRVRRLLGEPSEVHAPLTSLMFTGVHWLSPRAHASLPSRGCVIRESYRRWIDAGEVVIAVIDESPWRDLGTIAEYRRTNVDLASGTLVWPEVIASPRGNLIAADAHVDETCVEHSVIGPDATIAPGVRVLRSVVWAGAHVTRSITDEVVTN